MGLEADLNAHSTTPLVRDLIRLISSQVKITEYGINPIYESEIITAAVFGDKLKYGNYGANPTDVQKFYLESINAKNKYIQEIK